MVFSPAILSRAFTESTVARSRNLRVWRMLLDHPLYAVTLIMERRQCRGRLTMSKEALAGPRNNCRTRYCSGMQAVARRYHRQVARHHPSTSQVLVSHIQPPHAYVAAAKVVDVHARDPRAYSRIPQRHIHIGDERLSTANAKRANDVHVPDIHHIDIGDIYHVHAIESAAPPREARIKRTNRNPADRSKAKSESRAMAESNEGDERRRPHWTDKRRTRPPYP